MMKCEYGDLCRRKNLNHFYTDTHPEKILIDRFWQGITGVYENIMLDSVFKVHGCLPEHAYIFTYQAETEFLKKIFKSFDGEFDVDFVVDRKVNDVLELETGLKNLFKTGSSSKIKIHTPKSTSFSSHHPKLFLFKCKDFWYFAVSTANLVWYHWGNADHIPYTNLTWISPRFYEKVNVSSSMEAENASKTDLLKFLAAYDLGVTKTLSKHLVSLDFSSLESSIQFIHNSPQSFSWNSDSLKNSFKQNSENTENLENSESLENPENHSQSSTKIAPTEHILLSSVSSIQTISQPFIKKLLATTNTQQLMIQWPTEQFIKKIGLERNFVHCFGKKASIDKLLENKQLYHYSLSKKLPHLKVYIRLNKSVQKITHLVLTSQNLHGSSKNYEFGVVISNFSAESAPTMNFMPRRYAVKHDKPFCR